MTWCTRVGVYKTREEWEEMDADDIADFFADWNAEAAEQALQAETQRGLGKGREVTQRRGR